MNLEAKTPRRVTKESKQRLLTQVHLPDHISTTVSLKKTGHHWTGKCPFHDDSTASFAVYPDHYYCYGCKAHGDVIEYEMKRAGSPFAETIEALASRYRVSLEYTGESRQETEQDRQFKQYRHIMEEVADHFHKILMHAELGLHARKYLENRGFSEDFIKEWKLGLSLDKNTLVTLSEKRGWKKEHLVTLGLIRKSTRDQRWFDFFNDRIMIPIADERGQVIAFGGRIYKTEKTTNSPKYLNSPETPLFSKSNTLYNLHNARRFTLKEHGKLIVVEGYMDALALAKANFQNVVAVLGTALTNEHVRKISKYADDVLLCFDQDNAGKVASLRSFQIAYPLNIVTLKQVQFENAKDPDEFIQKFGAEEFANHLKNSPLMVISLCDEIKKSHNNPETLLKEIRAKILPSIMANPDAGTKEIALKLITQSLGLSSAKALLGLPSSKPAAEARPKPPPPQPQTQESFVWSVRSVEEIRWCASLLFATFKDLPLTVQSLLAKSSSAQEQLFVKNILLKHFSKKSGVIIRRLLEQILLHPDKPPLETLHPENTQLSEIHFLLSLSNQNEEFFRENRLQGWIKSSAQSRPSHQPLPRPDNCFEPSNKMFFTFMMKDFKLSFDKQKMKVRLAEIWNMIELSYLDLMIQALMQKAPTAEKDRPQYESALRLALDERNKRNMLKITQSSIDL